jgi:hypothetical protein
VGGRIHFFFFLFLGVFFFFIFPVYLESDLSFL